MSLTVGARLGSYEVLAPLGAGGMGEVYRARDTRLKREVAIKVLPDGFATDSDRLARFHREAELLASLNLAYQAINAGRTEVFVRPFPGPGGMQQISTGSGAFPMWSRAKPELLFISFNPMQIFTASYTASGDSFRADKPRVWSTTGILARPRLRSLNVHPDGERLVVSPSQDAQTIAKQDKLVFILNFSEELKRITAAT